MKLRLGLWVWLVVSGASCGSVSRGAFSEVRLFAAPAAYEAETAVALNDLALKEQEVGYALRATLHVRPLWTDPDAAEALLHFNLLKPKLHLRGKSLEASFRPFDSIWDSYSDTEFYVHWKSGIIQTAYLDPNEPVDILNYKKSIISLFQFQIIDGEYNETDISGTCNVLYDSISTDVFRKIKKNCGSGDAATAWDRELDARRVARYTLGAAPLPLREVFADELLQLRGAAAGVKARSWSRVRAAAAQPRPAPAPAADRAAALALLPPALRPAPLPLALDHAPGDDDEELRPEALGAALEDAALLEEEPGAGGSAALARALLRLLPALRAAPAPALRALLRADAPPAALAAACRLLGLAATRAAHAAADAFLHLAARDPLRPLALAYLAAFARAAEPHAGAVAAVARLAADARDPAVADAALLAAAAAAARLPPAAPGAADPARDLRDDIARALPRCKDEACRAARLRALGQLRREDAAELLLAAAERGGRAARLAALEALARLPARALPADRRRRLERLALRAGPALEVRAAALDQFVRRSAPAPAALRHTALALHRAGPLELRRVFWQRLDALAAADAAAARVVAALPPEVRAWPARALAGTSMALTRATGWRAGAWTARLDSLQTASAGLLRRGRVALHAVAPDNSTHDLLAVDVWTRGLDALAGAGAPDPRLGEEDAADGEVAGGIGLAVAGVALPPVELFASQAELLGHVWAGAGSTPTPLLRAAGAPAPLRLRVPLAGGAVATLRRAAAWALALDAHAAVSLWSRSARAQLDLRAAGAAEASARLRTAWGELRAEARAAAEPRLRVSADLDFYDVVALCVRVDSADYDIRSESVRSSALGARPLRVSRRRTAAERVCGRTLSLGRAPDAACAALRPGDD